MIDPSGGGNTYLVKNQTGDHYLDFTVEKADANSETVLTKSVFNNSDAAKQVKKNLKAKRVKGGDAGEGKISNQGSNDQCKRQRRV